MATIHRRLLEAHLDVMERQAAAHQAYLEVCARTQACLLQRARLAPGAGGSQPSPLATETRPERIEPWERSIASDPWVVDHTPAWTLPVLPLTVLLDMACQAALRASPGRELVRVVQIEARSWCAFSDGRLRGRTRVKPGTRDLVDVEVQVEASEARGGFRTCAAARIELGAAPAPPPVEPVPAPVEGVAAPCPYQTGALFHGPSLQLMSHLVEGAEGAQARVQAASRGVPVGLVNPGMLDACLHCVPFLEIARWYPELAAGKVAFPYRIRSLDFHRLPPTSGSVEVRVQKLRIEHEVLPVVEFWILDPIGLVLRFELTLALLPLGPLQGLDLADWRRFLGREGAVAGCALSRPQGAGRVLEVAGIRQLDWLPGSAARVYGLEKDDPHLAKKLAVADHLGQVLAVHPSRVVVDEAGRCANTPWNTLTVEVTADPGRVETRVQGPGDLDTRAGLDHWLQLGLDKSIVVDVGVALSRRCVRRVVLEDPAEMGRLRGRPVLYLANHQTAIESLLFCLVAVALQGAPCLGVTRTENQVGLLAAIEGLRKLLVGPALPVRMLAFDSQRPDTLLTLLDEYRRAASEEKASLYVAVEGQRALRADHQVTQLSSVFLDLAIEKDLPIVPVKFVGGLPAVEMERCLDLPHRMAGQDYYFGAALWPEELAELPYAERRRRILGRINGLGPEARLEIPNPPDPAFEARVAQRAASGLGVIGAVIVEALRDLEDAGEQTQVFLQLVEGTAGPTLALRNPLIQAIFSMLKMANA